MKLNVKQLYTSIACNRIPEIIDWNEQGLVCFGACNAVIIYDTVCFAQLTRFLFNFIIISHKYNQEHRPATQTFINAVTLQCG